MNVFLPLISALLIQYSAATNTDNLYGTYRTPTADGYEYIIIDERGKYYYYQSGKETQNKAKGYYISQGSSLLLRCYDELPECTYYMSEATRDVGLGKYTRITLQNKQGEPLANDTVYVLNDFAPQAEITNDKGELLLDFSKGKGLSIGSINPELFIYMELRQINNLTVQVYPTANEYTIKYNNYTVHPADGGIDIKSYQGYGKYFKRVDDLDIEEFYCN